MLILNQTEIENLLIKNWADILPFIYEVINIELLIDNINGKLIDFLEN